MATVTPWMFSVQPTWISQTAQRQPAHPCHPPPHTGDLIRELILDPTPDCQPRGLPWDDPNANRQLHPGAATPSTRRPWLSAASARPFRRTSGLPDRRQTRTLKTPELRY